MTRRDKLIQRLQRYPPEAKFSDVRALLKEFGWTEARTKGSHVSFTKPGEHRPQVVPTHNGVVKGRYVRQVFERLGLDTEEETN